MNINFGQLFISFFVAAVIVFPIHLVASGIYGSQKRKEKALEKAISRGNVVTAELKKKSWLTKTNYGNNPGWGRWGFYTYKYKEKNYKFRLWSEDPPLKIQLYFIDNPRKATTANDLTESKICWPLIYIVLGLFIYLIVGNM